MAEYLNPVVILRVAATLFALSCYLSNSMAALNQQAAFCVVVENTVVLGTVVTVEHITFDDQLSDERIGREVDLLFESPLQVFDDFSLTIIDEKAAVVRKTLNLTSIDFAITLEDLNFTNHFRIGTANFWMLEPTEKDRILMLAFESSRRIRKPCFSKGGMSLTNPRNFSESSNFEVENPVYEYKLMEKPINLAERRLQIYDGEELILEGQSVIPVYDCEEFMLRKILSIEMNVMCNRGLEQNILEEYSDSISIAAKSAKVDTFFLNLCIGDTKVVEVGLLKLKYINSKDGLSYILDPDQFDKLIDEAIYLNQRDKFLRPVQMSESKGSLDSDFYGYAFVIGASVLVGIFGLMIIKLQFTK